MSILDISGADPLSIAPPVAKPPSKYRGTKARADDPRRKNVLPPVLAANMWKPGQSGNPNGPRGTQGKSNYLECQRILREVSPATCHKLIALTNDPDSRIALLAVNSLLDRVGIKADASPESIARKLDVSALNDKELQQLKRITGKLIADRDRKEAAAGGVTIDQLAPAPTP